MGWQEWLRFSLRSLAVLVLGISIGLAVGLAISPYAAPPVEPELKVVSPGFKRTLPAYVFGVGDLVRVELLDRLGDGPHVMSDCEVDASGEIEVDLVGKVHVAGMTHEEAWKAVRVAAEDHGAWSESPVGAVYVELSRSKWYYVVDEPTKGGQGVSRFPATGNETVVDALAQFGGIGPECAFDVSERNVWIESPRAGGAKTKTIVFSVSDRSNQEGREIRLVNHQLLPGDRLFVSSKPVPKAR